jgi:hypothetical protein
MILMGVGQHQTDQIVAAAFDELGIGHDYIDARRIVVAEGDAAIDHQPFTGMAIEIEVHADLAGAAQGQKQQLVLAGYGTDPGIMGCV